MDINVLAIELAENVNLALDIVAPKKTFSIKPNYIQGLTDQAKDLLKSRDYCFPNVKQVFLLYLVGSLVTLIAY